MSAGRRVRQFSATQLAQLAKCERKIYFDARDGREPETVTPSKSRGNREHRRRELQLKREMEANPVAIPGSVHIPATRMGARDKRCFIATAVYGPEAPATNRLRRWRDECLAPHAWGRGLIGTYYRISPPIANFLSRHPCAAAPVRGLLNTLLVHRLSAREERHG